MKKTIILLAAICSLNLATAQDQQPAAAANGQPQKPNRPKPEMMASRHSKHLQKLLTLTDDQTKKTYDAMLTRFTEIQAVREKMGPDGDRKAMHEQIKPIRQKYVQTMNTILTPEQKTKWEEHRKEMKGKRKDRKEGKGGPPKDGGNGDAKKLNDDDDGIED